MKARYANYDEVLDYCRRSADPVGRILLVLYGAADRTHLAWSDAICSSLQLINFLQDVAIDFRKDRIYLPQDELARFGVTEEARAPGVSGARGATRKCFEVARARPQLE